MTEKEEPFHERYSRYRRLESEWSHMRTKIRRALGLFDEESDNHRDFMREHSPYDLEISIPIQWAEFVNFPIVPIISIQLVHENREKFEIDKHLKKQIGLIWDMPRIPLYPWIRGNSSCVALKTYPCHQDYKQIDEWVLVCNCHEWYEGFKSAGIKAAECIHTKKHEEKLWEMHEICLSTLGIDRMGNQIP